MQLRKELGNHTNTTCWLEKESDEQLKTIDNEGSFEMKQT